MHSTSDSPGSRPTHEFDQDFWSKLRVDMVLMTDDCYCFRIDEITAEGVISREWHSPRHLWTWIDLRECTIYRESSAGVGVGTAVREREGCGMTFELRREADGWRYDATFDYA